MRAQAGDKAAFGELVQRYERRLLYYIRRILGGQGQALDVLQEVWIRVFLKIGTLRSPEAFRVWLYKIAHDITVSHLRRKRHDLVSIETAELPAIDGGNEQELMENAELVHRTLEKLSQPHREVLTLRFLEEMNITQIAEVVGCNTGTVKSRLHYAKAALRRGIEGHDHER